MIPTQEPKKKTPTAEPTKPGRESQSQIDEQRGDWEGMGQSRFQPEEDAAVEGAKPKAPEGKSVTPRP